MLLFGFFTIFIAVGSGAHHGWKHRPSHNFPNAHGSATSKLEEVISWKQVTYDWPNVETRNEAVQSGSYIPENNLPHGLEVWNDKLFIAVPKWKLGVASTLNYISLNNLNQSKVLIPYPDWKANTPAVGDEQVEDNHMVSVFRTRADVCDRLWVLDDGQTNVFGGLVRTTMPAILIFNLKTDKLIRRYNLKKSDIKPGESLLTDIAVDITNGNCDKAFAYIPDVLGYGVIVYSFSDNDSWRVTHNYFYFSPLLGNFLVSGFNVHLHDGVLGLALGPADINGDRTIYFHALVSNDQFSTNSRVLKNKTLALDVISSFGLYKHEGYKGKDTQASGAIFDEKTNVLLLGQVLTDGVTCWNPKTALKKKNMPLILQDHEKLIFISDMKIDSDGNLWILSDKTPIILFYGLNSTDVNYRILRIPIEEAIKGTVCSQ